MALLMRPKNLCMLAGFHMLKYLRHINTIEMVPLVFRSFFLNPFCLFGALFVSLARIVPHWICAVLTVALTLGRTAHAMLQCHDVSNEN